MKYFSFVSDTSILTDPPTELVVISGISDAERGYSLTEQLDDTTPASFRKAAHRLIDKFFDHYDAQSGDQP